MLEFSLDALEYYRLKELLGRYVSTEAGRFALDELTPMLDELKLESEHAITAEAMSYLREHRVPFNDIALLGQALEKLAIAGATLEIPEIEAIQSFLSQIRSEEHTSELQSQFHLVCRLLLEKKNNQQKNDPSDNPHFVTHRLKH